MLARTALPPCWIKLPAWSNYELDKRLRRVWAAGTRLAELAGARAAGGPDGPAVSARHKGSAPDAKGMDHTTALIRLQLALLGGVPLREVLSWFPSASEGWAVLGVLRGLHLCVWSTAVGYTVVAL